MNDATDSIVPPVGYYAYLPAPLNTGTSYARGCVLVPPMAQGVAAYDPLTRTWGVVPAKYRSYLECVADNDVKVPVAPSSSSPIRVLGTPCKLESDCGKPQAMCGPRPGTLCSSSLTGADVHCDAGHCAIHALG